MNVITIHETLLDVGEGRVVLANDSASRPMLGLQSGAPSDGAPRFVEIDRVTMLELERGVVDVRTVFADRCAGVAVEA